MGELFTPKRKISLRFLGEILTSKAENHTQGPRIAIARDEEGCFKLDPNRAGNECRKHYSSATQTIPAPNTCLWRSDLLLRCYEIFLVITELSHKLNAPNRARNKLRMGEKQTLD